MEERLRKFAHLVESGSFTKASAQLHVSQPALSTAITKLERELHAPLLVRGNRSFKLTEAGKAAYATAKELSVSTTNLKAAIDTLTHQPPKLAIGMIDSLASAFFGNKTYVEQLEKQANILVDVNNSRHLIQAVEHDQLDAAFITEVQQNHRLIQSLHLGSEPLILVCHRQAADQYNQNISKCLLPNFISYDQPSGTRKLIQTALNAHHITPTTSLFSTSPEVMLQMVLLQKGAAVLPYSLVRQLLSNKTLYWLGPQSPIIIERNIGTVVRRGKHISPVMQATMQTIKNILADQRQAAIALAQR